jgi:cation diffusion facilitator CzcD-associated flavoprotein CzcO
MAHSRIAIVGSGFAGLGLGIRLRQAGIEDFVILERADEVGGTWRDNTYPGCQCDVPSALYSFSFAPNPEWSRTFSRQPEIQEYLLGCADRFGVRSHVRFGQEVLDASWEAEERRWRIETSTGEMTADVLVSAVGGLSEPKLPDIAGIDRFEGTLFHSAAWDHDHDLTGERVAVIGTGASAIQFIPRIQPHVGQMHVFQRTPAWVLPHSDRPVTALERRLFRRIPGAQRIARALVYALRELLVLGLTVDRRIMKLPERIGLRHLRSQVPDPELRRKLTPRFTLGCKRILISNEYYPALTEPNVEVVTDGIAEVRERSIVTADGRERPVDTIICGTGFHVTDMPVATRVRGRHGLTLDDVWQGSPQAYLGTTVAGFPNFFMLLGPNTGLGHTSIVYMIESQLAHVLECLQAMDRNDLAALEVREDAQAEFNARVQAQMKDTVWTSGGCMSWYIDEHGRNTTLWPDFTWRYRRRTAELVMDHYRGEPRERGPLPAVPEPALA